MKRITAFLVFFVMIFSIFPTMTFATNSNAGGMEEVEKEFNVLVRLGFFDENTYINPEEECLRGEFIAAIVKALTKQTDGDAPQGETGFVDVKPTDAGAWIAVQAKALGLVNGTEFMADKPINGTEAATIAVRMLGYESIIDVMGGYPVGYMSVAKMLGVVDNVENLGGNLTQRDAIKLLFNCLDAKVYDLLFQGLDVETLAESKTFGEQMFNLYNALGTVNATEMSALFGHKRTDAGKIKVNNDIYVCEDIDAAELIGFRARFYYIYDKDLDRKTIIYVHKGNYNNELYIDSEQIVSYSNRKYTYYRDGSSNRTYSVSVPSDIDILYNGETPTKEFLYKPDCGEVRLIDNNDDNEYDVLMIMNYSLIAVKERSLDEFKIINEFNVPKNLVLNPSEKMIHYFDGKSFRDIGVGSVVEAAVSQSGELVYVKVTNETVEGIPEKFSSNKVTIGGVTYDVYENCPQIEAGADGIFRIDSKNRIVFYEKGSLSDYEMGILKNIALKEEAFDSYLMFRIFTEDGEFINVNSGERIIVNGEVYKDLSTAKALISDTNTPYELIRFKRTDKGVLKEIELAEKYSDSLDFSDDSFRELYYPKTSIKSVSFYFSNKFYRRKGVTKIFTLPSNLEDESLYTVALDNDNYFEWGIYYTLSAYSTSDKQYAEYLVAHNGGKNTTYCSVISDVSSMLNEEGEVVTSLVLTDRVNKFVEFVCTEDASAGEELRKGDVIIYKLNPQNKIISYTKFFDERSLTMVGGSNPTGSVDTAHRLLFGNVYDNKDGTLYVTKLDPENVKKRSDYELVLPVLNDRPYPDIFIYDRFSGTLTYATADDIKGYKAYGDEYSKVIAESSDSAVRMIVIYE